MDAKTLLSVPVGGTATVHSLDFDPPMERRLLDLGLTPGTQVRCLFAAPAGSPRAYLIRGAVIALRNSDAAHIGVGGSPLWD